MCTHIGLSLPFDPGKGADWQQTPEVCTHIGSLLPQPKQRSSSRGPHLHKRRPGPMPRLLSPAGRCSHREFAAIEPWGMGWLAERHSRERLHAGQEMGAAAFACWPRINVQTVAASRPHECSRMAFAAMGENHPHFYELFACANIVMNRTASNRPRKRSDGSFAANGPREGSGQEQAPDPPMRARGRYLGDVRSPSPTGPAARTRPAVPS